MRIMENKSMLVKRIVVFSVVGSETSSSAIVLFQRTGICALNLIKNSSNDLKFSVLYNASDESNMPI